MRVKVRRGKKGKPDKPPGKPGKAYALAVAPGSFNLWMARVTGEPDAPQPPTEPQGRTIVVAPGAYRAKIALGNWDDVVQ